MDEKIIRLISLPPSSKGFVLDDPNGDHNIYINRNLDPEEQMNTYIHECRHIGKNHLHRDIPVEKAELEVLK